MTGHYELLYILPGNLTEEEAQPASQAIHQLIKDQGASIVKEDFWGKRKLAYEIDKFRQGYYDLVEFDLETDKLPALDQILRLHESVLRYQIVHRIVKTPEQLAAEKQLQERLAAKRQAQKEKETVEAMATEAEPAPAKPAEPVADVNAPELEQKLEEILDEDTVDV